MSEKKKEAALLGFLFLQMIAWNFVFSVIVGFYEGAMKSSLPWWGVEVILEAGNVLLVFLHMEKRGLNILEALRFKKIRFFTILKVLALTYAVEQVGTFFNILSQFVAPNEALEMSSQMLQGSATTALLVAGVIAPIYEEICFRGVIYDRYKKVTSVWKAVLMSGLFFGLFHMNLNQFCYALVLGIFFALANEACGSILPSIIMHAWINGSTTFLFSLLMKYASMTGLDLLREAQASSAREVLMPMLVNYGFRALAGFAIAVLLLIHIARGEGREDVFLSALINEKAKNDPEKDPEELSETRQEGDGVLLMNLPTILVLLVTAGYILLPLFLSK